MRSWVVVISALIGHLINIIDCNTPNIIFFMTDDWGFNDVGFHLNTDTRTPFLDALSMDEGLMIEKYYAYPLCTITRAALLTGRYAIRYGLHDSVIDYESKYALSKRETTIAEEFRANGYSTHAIGKWHLGSFNWAYTPTYRGFDTFFGYYGGALYYYEHYGDDEYFDAYDFRDGIEKYNEPNRYSLYLWAERAQLIIDEISKSDNTNPFFMYFAWQGSHTPTEADGEYLKDYVGNRSDEQVDTEIDRLVFQAQTTMTDDLLKAFVGTLKQTGTWDNTLLVFASDNGGMDGYGDNSPLRGEKATVWEGGVRLPTFITGGALPKHLRGKLFDSYPMHVTDWYKTLLTAAGLTVTQTKNPLDGEDMWSLLQTATKSTVDTYTYALDSNAFKNGINRGINDDYIANGGLDAKRDLYDTNLYTDGTLDDLLKITDRRVMLINADNNDCDSEICGALIYAGRWKIIYGDQSQVGTSCTWERTFESSTNDILGCGAVPLSANNTCYCKNTVCLFDLLNDPCEYYDVASDNPALTQKLYLYLEEYYNDAVPALSSIIGDANASLVDPSNEDGSTGYWYPWCDTPWYENEFEIILRDLYHQSENKNDTEDNSKTQSETETETETEDELSIIENKNSNSDLKLNSNSNVFASINYYDYYLKNGNNNPHFKFFVFAIIAILAIAFFWIFPFCSDITQDCKNLFNGNNLLKNHGTFKKDFSTYGSNNNNNSNYDNGVTVISETSPLMVQINSCKDQQSYTVEA